MPQVENVKVESGPEGYARFLHDVRELFGITAELEMELTFDCAEPATGGVCLDSLSSGGHGQLPPQDTQHGTLA